MDYDKEKQIFAAKLAQAREKFITQWGSEELSQVTRDILHANSEKLQHSIHEKKIHKDELDEIRHNYEANRMALHDHRRQIAELQEELVRLNEESEERLAENKQAETDHKLVTEDVDREKRLLSAQEKAVSEKLSVLEKSSSMFQERLGLSFKKTSGGRLQVVFTCIDEKATDEKFFFYVQINDGNYIVSGSEPALSDLDALVEKLNATNNFRSFVIAVRKAFKKSLNP